MRETNIQFLWKMARESSKDVKELRAIVIDLQNQIDELKNKPKVGRPRKNVV